MNITRTKMIASLTGIAILAPVWAPVVGASVQEGDNPGQWGPPLAEICDEVDVATANALGYNVFVLNNANNTFTGTPDPDAIFALGGNDRINGAGGDDLICLGDGYDKGRGAGGDDAVFGEGDGDRIQGNIGADYLDGGAQNDECVGGAGFDVQNDCEVWTQ